MKFGYFDDAQREYVITTPQTPRPWNNYLCNESLISRISNSAGGCSYHYRDNTRYALLRNRGESLPPDNSGRYFYLKEGDDFWSPGWKPVKRGLTEYQCRHGLGYTIIKGVRNGLAAEVLFFVPVSDSCEIHKLVLTNTTEKQKKIMLFSCVEFSPDNRIGRDPGAREDVAEVEVNGSAIYHTTGYRGGLSGFAFYSVNRQIAGFDTDREHFTGRFNGFDAPEAVVDGVSRNSIAQGSPPMASHCISIVMTPKETVEIVFILGYVDNGNVDKWDRYGVLNKTNALALIERYATGASVDNAFEELVKYWDAALSRSMIDTQEERLNRMVNTWAPYQCAVSAALLGSSLSDSREAAAWRAVISASAGNRLDVLSVLLPGIAGSPSAATDIGAFEDNPLLSILAIAARVKETGESDILDRPVSGGATPQETHSLQDHLMRIFTDTCGKTAGLFQAANPGGGERETISAAASCAVFGTELAALLKFGKKRADAKKVQQHVDRIKEAVRERGWGGESYLSVSRVESLCNCARIFLEDQALCALAQIGIEKGYPGKALDSACRALDTPHGLLNADPPFTPGMNGNPPGYSDNSGILCHVNALYIIAETLLGRGDSAFDHLKKIMPSYREELSDIDKSEPFAYSYQITGSGALHPGEARGPWSPVAVVMNYLAVTRFILGIQPEYDGLRIDPCIPADWNGFAVTRIFRGSTYKITVKNPAHKSKGISQMLLNGSEIKGNLLPVIRGGNVQTVEVMMG